MTNFKVKQIAEKLCLADNKNPNDLIEVNGETVPRLDVYVQKVLLVVEELKGCSQTMLNAGFAAENEGPERVFKEMLNSLL